MSRHKSFLQDNNILNKEIIHYSFNERKTQTKSCIIPHTLKKNYKNHFLSHGVGPLGGVFGLYHSTFFARTRSITPPTLCNSAIQTTKW